MKTSLVLLSIFALGASVTAEANDAHTFHLADGPPRNCDKVVTASLNNGRVYSLGFNGKLVDGVGKKLPGGERMMVANMLFSQTVPPRHGGPLQVEFWAGASTSGGGRMLTVKGVSSVYEYEPYGKLRSFRQEYLCRYQLAE